MLVLFSVRLLRYCASRYTNHMKYKSIFSVVACLHPPINHKFWMKLINSFRDRERCGKHISIPPIRQTVEQQVQRILVPLPTHSSGPFPLNTRLRNNCHHQRTDHRGEGEGPSEAEENIRHVHVSCFKRNRSRADITYHTHILFEHSRDGMASQKRHAPKRAGLCSEPFPIEWKKWAGSSFRQKGFPSPFPFVPRPAVPPNLRRIYSAHRRHRVCSRFSELAKGDVRSNPLSLHRFPKKRSRAMVWKKTSKKSLCRQQIYFLLPLLFHLWASAH